jgi:hypothetical protein
MQKQRDCRDHQHARDNLKHADTSGRMRQLCHGICGISATGGM